MSHTDTLRRQAFVFNSNLNTDSDSNTFRKQLEDFVKLNEGNDRSLTIYLTSTGGYPKQAFEFADLIRSVSAAGHHVTVHLLGQVSGFNYLVAAAADRFIMEPTSSITFAQMFVVAKGRMHELVEHIANERAVYDKFVAAVVKRSGGKIGEAVFRSWKTKHLCPQEAVAYGLCDEVLSVPQTAVPRSDKPEYVVEVESFYDGAVNFTRMIKLHIWLENPANDGLPIRVRVFSKGGTVVQALSLYGQLCEAMRMGHHVTIEVAGKAYSCAMWFTTCALKAGTVEINSDSKLMFHEISVQRLEGTLDVIEFELAIHQGMYRQACDLLCSMVPEITPTLLKEWEDLHEDRYLDAQEAASLGMGVLVDRVSPGLVKEREEEAAEAAAKAAKEEAGDAPAAATETTEVAESTGNTGAPVTETVVVVSSVHVETPAATLQQASSPELSMIALLTDMPTADRVTAH